MVVRLSASLAALALAACVTDTTVIGDARSRAACEEAMVLEAPPRGCTTAVRIESWSPHGCGLHSDGVLLDDLSASWVRLRRLPAFVRVRDLDAVPGGPGASLHLTGGGAAACSCDRTALASFGIGAETFEWPLVDVDQELLFSTARRFEVQICTLEEDPFPRCGGAGGDAGPTCPGLPSVRSGAFCACLPPCASTAECPVPATGSASVECTASRCELRCRRGTHEGDVLRSSSCGSCLRQRSSLRRARRPREGLRALVRAPALSSARDAARDRLRARRGRARGVRARGGHPRRRS